MCLTCNKHYFGSKRNFASQGVEVETEIANTEEEKRLRGRKKPSQAELYKYHHKSNEKRFNLEVTDVFLSKKKYPQ